MLLFGTLATILEIDTAHRQKYILNFLILWTLPVELSNEDFYKDRGHRFVSSSTNWVTLRGCVCGQAVTKGILD